MTAGLYLMFSVYWMKMNNKPNIATYLLPLSVFSLSAALIYFTFIFSQVVEDIPLILEKVEVTSNKIKPVITEVSKIRELIPPITHEVTELRKKIPAILDEVKKTRELVPSVVTEIQNVREITPSILKEVKQTRESIPAILKEVEQTRKEIPGLLVKAENLIKNAQKIAKKTSEGAVTGVFAGILKAPFKLIGGVFNSGNLTDASITNKDRELASNAANDALDSGEINKPYAWSNEDSENSGTVSVTKKEMIGDRDCRSVTFIIMIPDKEPIKNDHTVCLNDNGVWEEHQK